MKMTKETATKLNELLGRYPENEAIILAGKDIELMKRLHHDGLVRIYGEIEEGKYQTEINSTGVLFRLRGGYKVEERNYGLWILITSLIAAIASVLTAIHTYFF